LEASITIVASEGASFCGVANREDQAKLRQKKHKEESQPIVPFTG